MYQIPFYRPCKRLPCPGHSPQCYTLLGKIPGTPLPLRSFYHSPKHSISFVPWEAQHAVQNFRAPPLHVSPLASPNIFFILREAPKSNSEL